MEQYVSKHVILRSCSKLPPDSNVWRLCGLGWLTSVTWFILLKNGYNNFHFLGLIGKLNEVRHMKHSYISQLRMCLSIACVFSVHVQMPCAIFTSMSCRLFCSLWFGLHSPSKLPGTRSRRRCFGSIAPDNLGFGRSWRNYLLTLQCLQPSPGHFVIRHLKQFLGALKHDSSSLPGLHISVNDPKVWFHSEKD